MQLRNERALQCSWLVAAVLSACTDSPPGMESEAESEAEAEAEAEGEAEAESEGEGEAKVDCTGADDCTCEDACARDEICLGSDYDTCVSDCPCFKVLLRPEVVLAFYDCYALSTCETESNACLDEALEELGVTPTFETFAAACDTRAAECADDFGGICETTYGAFEDEIIEGFQSCLAGECGDIEFCMIAVVVAATPQECL